jgi:hypothetical protein
MDDPSYVGDRGFDFFTLEMSSSVESKQHSFVSVNNTIGNFDYGVFALVYSDYLVGF